MKFSTLLPPLFNEPGDNVTREEAIENGLWIATVNLWLITDNDEGSIIYQVRGKDKAWAPGKLEVEVGGKVGADESSFQAIKRESLLLN